MEAPTNSDDLIARPSRARAWGWVAILVAAYACSVVDRQVLSLMVDLIKADLGISDREFSLLHGLSFAMLYTVLGFPIGALADRLSRSRVIGIGILCWSAMTAVSGLASRFSHLFLARVGVGIGEATLSPAAYSLLSDSFPPAKLGRAISVYVSGGGLGSGLALMFGGAIIGMISSFGPVVLPVVGELRSWQAVFLIVSLPGFPIAAVILSMSEPPRTGRASIEPASWARFATFVRQRWRFTLSFMLAMAFVSAGAAATMTWMPALVMRVHHLSAAQTGMLLGPVVIVGIVGGLLSGAWITELLQRRGVQMASLRVSLGGALAMVPSAIAVAYAPTVTTLMAAATMLMFFNSLCSGIMGAVLLSLTPNEMRARISALLLFCQNAFGLVVGPLLPAILTDFFAGGGTALRNSLGISLALFGSCASAAFIIAARHLPSRVDTDVI